MEVEISIIIPVYNTEKYLENSINSVINQKIENIELIVVNDCSTDNSLKIIEKLAKKDRRIKVINKEVNEGLELARRTGIKHSTGKYIYHLDSDDWLVNGSLDKLLKIAKENDADIVTANNIRVLDKFAIIREKSAAMKCPSGVVSKKEFLKENFVNFFGINQFPVSMWAKLYKSDFVKKNAPDLLGFDFGEDLNYNIQIFSKAERLIFSNEYVYHYRFGGMTSKHNPKMILSAIKLYKLKRSLIDFYDKKEFIHFINIELLNYLRSHIRSIIIFKKNNFQKNALEINQLILNDEYLYLKNYFNEVTTYDSDFLKAFKSGNTEEMYSIIEKEVRNDFLKYNLKKLISKILN